MKNEEYSKARVLLVKFFYQCYILNVGNYPEKAFSEFLSHFEFEDRLSPEAYKWAKEIAEKIFDHFDSLDQLIEGSSDKWSLARINTIDRIILRLCGFELLTKITPAKVALNEAVELAKIFGTADSSRFVNGVMDAIAKKIKADSSN